MTMLGSDTWVDVLSAIAWPLVGLVAIVVLLVVPNVSRTIGRTFGRVRRFQGFGFEFELTEEAAKSAQHNLDDINHNYQVLVDREFAHQVDLYELSAIHENYVERHFKNVVTDQQYAQLEKLRSTIHVPDVLSTSSLYQLLDYYPTSGGGRGRRFSQRFGIVGESWRLQRSVAEGKVPEARDDLIRQWGMTAREAAQRGSGRASFICILLRNADVPEAILYFDAEGEDAFFPGMNREQIEDRLRELEEAAAESQLTARVTAVCAELRTRTPGLRIGE